MRPVRQHTGVLLLAAVAAVVLVVLAALAWPDGRGRATSDQEVLVVLDAPVSAQPWVAGFMRQGAELAVDQLNAAGGMATGAGRRHVRLEVLDNGGQPARAQADARRAVQEHAVLLLTDGTGALGVASVSDPAHLPVVICFNGGADLVDPARHPTLFRMAPENKAMARRLADYVANSKPKMAIISDDSEYGTQGRTELKRAFAFDEVEVVADQQVPQNASDLAPQVLAARRAGADHLVVWATSTNVAAAVAAARGSGWDVPVYTGPTGEDPLVRQRLAAHPNWVTGLTFASFRITSEVGPAPYQQFRSLFEQQQGSTATGLTQDGKKVVQPPDWAMFTYDTVQLAAASLATSRPDAGALLDGLQHTVITGANGDERGYTADQHEGVNPSDIYFGRFTGFVYLPVTDDPLSGSLSAVDQLE